MGQPGVERWALARAHGRSLLGPDLLRLLRLRGHPIGTAKLFNLRLAKNFSYPYMASSREGLLAPLHMTLSVGCGTMSNPARGNRVGTARRT